MSQLKEECNQHDEEDCYYLVYDNDGIWCGEEYVNDFRCPFNAKPVPLDDLTINRTISD